VALVRNRSERHRRTGTAFSQLEALASLNALDDVTEDPMVFKALLIEPKRVQRVAAILLLLHDYVANSEPLPLHFSPVKRLVAAATLGVRIVRDCGRGAT
jgi:hypothetical protein